MREELAYLKPSYLHTAPLAEYPPIHYKIYDKQQAIWTLPNKLQEGLARPVESLAALAPEIGAATVAAFTSAFVAAAVTAAMS